MIYLNSAATAHNRPEEVHAAMARALRESAGVPWGHGGDDAAALLDSCRQEAAMLLGVGQARRVIFTAGATDALNMAIKGVLSEGDHVVTTSLNHAAVSRPLTHMQMKGQLSLTCIEASSEGRLDPQGLEAALRHRTRLVVIPHGCNALGVLQPVEEIARRLKQRDVRLLVDAAHTAGSAPVDVEGWGADMVAVAGHKGLFGPPGTGMLLLGSDVRVRPLREGAGGGDAALAIQPLDLPWALESGMPNLPGVAGLRAGLRFVRSQGIERLAEHQTTLIKRFIGAIGLDERFDLVAARGDLPRTGTVAFSLKGFAASQVADILDRTYDMRVGAGLHDCPGLHHSLKSLAQGSVRVSVDWFSTEADVDGVVAALREIADAGIDKALLRAGAPAGRTAVARGQV